MAYALLAVVLGALVLSLVQVYRSTPHTGLAHDVFVPPCQILWLRGVRPLEQPITSQFLDQLVFRLTSFYHVLTLYLLHESDQVETIGFDRADDVTYVSYVPLAPVTLWVLQQPMEVVPGDVLTVPWHLPVVWAGKGTVSVLHWSLHPVFRPYKERALERMAIVREWQRRTRKSHVRVKVET